MAVNSRTPGLQESGMPEGDALQQQIQGRNRRSRIWLALFQLALVIAIVALLALLYGLTGRGRHARRAGWQ